jgi:hypothetical protein
MLNAQTLHELAGFAHAGNFSSAHPLRVQSFRLTTPSRGSRQLAISWECENACRAVLMLTGAVDFAQEVPTSGELGVRAPRTGMVFAQLLAWDADAVGGMEPTLVEMREVRLDAAAVDLRLSANDLYGKPGELLRLSWQAKGTSCVLLRRPLHGEELDLPPWGSVDAAVDVVVDVIELVAMSPDRERQVTRICQMHPVAQKPDCLLAELSTLAQPWRGQL